jgi:hypothetical protein
MRPQSRMEIVNQETETRPRLNRERIRETLHEIIKPEVDEKAILRTLLDAASDQFKEYFNNIPECLERERIQLATQFYRDVANMRASLYRDYKSNIHLSTSDKDFRPSKLGWAEDKRIAKVLDRNPALERVWNSIKALAYSWHHEITSRVAAKEGFLADGAKGPEDCPGLSDSCRIKLQNYLEQFCLEA